MPNRDDNFEYKAAELRDVDLQTKQAHTVWLSSARARSELLAEFSERYGSAAAGEVLGIKQQAVLNTLRRRKLRQAKIVSGG